MTEEITENGKCPVCEEPIFPGRKNGILGNYRNLVRDTTRLDAMINNQWFINTRFSDERDDVVYAIMAWQHDPYISDWHDTPRAAIDEAMKRLEEK